MDCEALLRWVKASLPFPQESEITLYPLSGDAGFRQYFRVSSKPSVMAVFAPPQREDNAAFVHKGLAFAAAGVHVPQVYAIDFERGYMLQEDLGDQLYLDALDPDTVTGLYGAAEDTLLALQGIEPPADLFASYDTARLQTEMALFPEWFAKTLLGATLSDDDEQILTSLFELLVDNALAQPQVVLHRDFHARNLLVLPDCGVGVVDYQDAVVGPITYDLVSLLKDCYIAWPHSLVRNRALNYRDKAVKAGLMTHVSDADFLRWFDLMGLQRHIKVLGIFARLSLRDGKHRYLDDLPLVIHYTLEAADRYAPTRGFAQWFRDNLLPVAQQQHWYRAIEVTGD